jgi:hypothetical protein
MGPLDEIRGPVSCRYFFRRAAGTGGVLVGGAGVDREFVTGDGMTEAPIEATLGAVLD